MNEFNITQKEIDDGKGLAGLAYITWVGLLIAFLTGKENRFVMYHVQQGLVLLIASLLVVIPFIGWFLWSIFILVCVIIGLINGFSGKVQPLPLIGKLGYKFNLVKPAESSGAPTDDSSVQQTPPPPPPPENQE